MPDIEFKGQSLEVDEDGFMQDPKLWNKEIAKFLAEKEGIEMTDEHWEIVNFLRQYYEQYEIAPMIRILVKEVKKKFGPEKGNLKYVYQLFPNGPAKQACKIAGLPKPTGCV